VHPSVRQLSSSAPCSAARRLKTQGTISILVGQIEKLSWMLEYMEENSSDESVYDYCPSIEAAEDAWKMR
jgi:hypothetical protein